jgi:hypothetical protein
MAAYSANQLCACSSLSGGKSFTGVRRTPAPAKASARASPTWLSDEGDLGNFMPVRDIKIEIIAIRAALPAFKVLKNHEQTRFRSGVDMTGECPFLCTKFGSFKMPLMRSTQMSLVWYWICTGMGGVLIGSKLIFAEKRPRADKE